MEAAVQHDDPLAPLQRRAKRLRRAALLTVPVVGVWALWPATPSVPERPPAPPPTRTAAVPRPVLQLAAFDAPIWTFDPPPPAPATPPPPLRLQLVGVLRDAETAGAVLKAVIYDPDADALVVVAEGAKVGTPARTVVKVEAAGITLSDAAGQRRLLLEPNP